LLWMLSTSAKPSDQTMQREPTLLADPPEKTLAFAAENYAAVWNDPVVDFPLYFRNTLVVALLAVTGVVISSAIAAYGFARVRWRGRGVFFVVTLATMMIPFPVLMGPLYVMYSELGW